MFGKLLFLFILVPFIEISLLIKLGSFIGFWPTLLIQLLTGILGASLARLQGLLVWKKIQLEFQSGRLPAEDMLNAVLILAAGIVLMTPGLLTDLLGFSLLLPTTRNIFKRWLRREFDARNLSHS
jgi:UPF0716 protein FxsA